MPIQVSGIDHLYVAVSDMARSEAFYDDVMKLLGFRKGTKAIAGEPHVHYFNQYTQYTIRPARAGTSADAYAVGALHHLCFRVADRDAVDAVFAALGDLGIDASAPAFYPEYRDDYYATFFSDPDGVRLEVVCNTALRDLVRERWDELDDFDNPVSKLPESA